MKKKTSDILEKQVLSEKDILLLKRRLNNWDKPEDIDIEKEYEITPEQSKKGFDYLWDQYRTPTGKERKNNPFGEREQIALETFQGFTFDGFYNVSDNFRTWNEAIYTVLGKKASFQYTMKAGKVYIIG